MPACHPASLLAPDKDPVHDHWSQNPHSLIQEWGFFHSLLDAPPVFRHRKALPSSCGLKRLPPPVVTGPGCRLSPFVS